MRNFFSVDGKFFTLCSRIVDMILLSIFTLIGSLLIITAVPAWSALNFSVKKCVIDERGRAYREYLAHFRKYFVPGIKYGAAVMPAVILLSVLLWKLLSSAPSSAAVFAVVAAFLLLVLLLGFAVWLCILFPMDGLPANLLPKLSFVALIRNLPVSLLMLAVLVTGIFFVLISPPLLIILPALVSLLCIRLTRSALMRLCPNCSYYNIQEKQQ